MKERVIKNDFYEILPLKEVKHFLRINGEHDDELLLNLAKTAIQFVENFLGFEVEKKEIMCSGVFEKKMLLRKPFLEIISVKDSGFDIPYRVISGFLHPITKVGSKIEVIYTVGIEKEDLKSDLKTALMAHLLSLYDFKGGSGKVPSMSLEIYNQYKVINF